ncbi:MAG TPA: hypothetical protein DDW52_25865 [Planctomycetaceae bacterium]|nr:hypothetical protein [Planctomycetaceae bacterium]
MPHQLARDRTTKTIAPINDHGPDASQHDFLAAGLEPYRGTQMGDLELWSNCVANCLCRPTDRLLSNT